MTTAHSVGIDFNKILNNSPRIFFKEALLARKRMGRLIGSGHKFLSKHSRQ